MSHPSHVVSFGKCDLCGYRVVETGIMEQCPCAPEPVQAEEPDIEEYIRMMDAKEDRIAGLLASAGRIWQSLGEARCPKMVGRGGAWQQCLLKPGHEDDCC